MRQPGASRPLREARVDLGAISANVGALRAMIGAAHAMAVVKAGGYGHGAVRAARAALDGGADWLGVVDLDEALALRSAGIDAPILAWLHDPHADFAAALEAKVDIGVSSVAQLEGVASTPSAHRPQVHIKVDTGLGRNGVTIADAPEVFARAAELERRDILHVRGVFSHLANAGPEADAAQIETFGSALTAAAAAGLDPELRHLASTAGALRVPASRYDLVRLGIGVYGLSPFDDATSADLGLRPAMELSAAVASVKRVRAGSGVSYGHTYRTDAETTLALVPLGYADGVPRQASGTGPVRIGEATYPVAGRVAMDQIVVDVGDAEVRVGDRAVLFGDPSTGVPSVDEWADAAGTINYDIVTRIGPRVERTYRA